MTKERLVAFTDAILAIIMTILVLELAKPARPTLAAFWALRTSFLSYTLSFFWLGSLWYGLHTIWDEVEKIDGTVIWWNLALLFFASLIPYATSLCGEYFNSRIMQSFYGIVVIVMTVVNYILHKALDKPNRDVPALLAATESYRRMLAPDIAIKCVGLVLALTVYPPAMMYSVLIAAIFIMSAKHIEDKKRIKNNSANA